MLQFNELCKNSHLELNLDKAEKLIFYFRISSSSLAVIFLMSKSSTLILVSSMKEAVECSSFLVPLSFHSTVMSLDHVPFRNLKNTNEADLHWS